MANQSASPLVQQPQSGDELQGRGCPSRLAGPQTRGSQRGEKTRPVSDRAIGHPLEQGHRAFMQSRRIGWAASQRGPQGSSSRPRLWRSRPCQRLPSSCALFASSSNNSLVGALCRWHRHAVPRDLWAVPVGGFVVRVVEFWAAGQDTPKGNPDGSIVLAVHLAVRSV